MPTKVYLLIATGVFIAAVTGSDLFARMTIAGLPPGVALAEHLHWASLTVVGIAFLFAPFAGVALICSAANRRAKTRSAVACLSLRWRCSFTFTSAVSKPPIRQC